MWQPLLCASSYLWKREGGAERLPSISLFPWKCYVLSLRVATVGGLALLGRWGEILSTMVSLLPFLLFAPAVSRLEGVHFLIRMGWGEKIFPMRWEGSIIILQGRDAAYPRSHCELQLFCWHFLSCLGLESTYDIVYFIIVSSDMVVTDVVEGLSFLGKLARSFPENKVEWEQHETKRRWKK